MSQPQAGIIPEPSSFALFLVLRVRQPSKNGSTVARVSTQVPALVKKTGAIDPRAKLVGTLSFGAKYWDVISPRKRPAHLRAFKPVRSGSRTAPATGGDILLHFSSRRQDINFELATKIKHLLGDKVTVLDEVHGFRYLDKRDLTGFIDGTENPKGRERVAAALVGEEDPAFAGGSYVFTQRYVHNLKKWLGLSQIQQEKVIGRTKRHSRELSDRAKPPTAISAVW